MERRPRCSIQPSTSRQRAALMYESPAVVIILRDLQEIELRVVAPPHCLIVRPCRHHAGVRLRVDLKLLLCLSCRTRGP